MAYRVELTRNAETELEDLYLWVFERAARQGTAWFNGLEQAILSLERLPTRCHVASDPLDRDQPVRVLNYGRRAHVFRVFFTIAETSKVVRILHIRRGARQEPTHGDLKGD